MRTTKLAGLTALSLVLFACGSDDGNNNGTSNTTGAGVAPAVLVKGSPVGPDGTCANGGTKIDVGADKNGNGQLDPDEVTGSQEICNAGAAPALTTVTPSGPSDKCKFGGTTVKSGADTNGNGKLDDNEVTQTDEICGGGTDAELANTTAIPEGDARCPFGGQSTDVGYDNGANGGVAGDGVLQQGEVLGTQVTCAGYGNALVPPSGNAGTSMFVNAGGTGSTAAGGNGGPMTLGSNSGLGGGDVKIWNTGSLAVDFQVPQVTPTFGATKMDVTANKTIASYGSSANAADGEYYTINNNGLYYRQSSGNAQIPVTGVHVAPNVTLTFPAPGINFTISDDFHNEGTLTSGFTGNNRGGIQMTVSRFIGAPGSKVTMTGQASANAAGGNGGTYVVNGDQIYDQSTIDASGAAGDPNGSYAGGAGGTVALVAARAANVSGPLFHVGDVKTTGGTGKTTGGSGGAVEFVGYTKNVSLKGNFDQSGGVGVTGGSGGIFVVEAVNGPLAYAGKRTARGADVDEASCGNASCVGGTGGQMLFAAIGGDLAWAGDNLANGGKSKNAAGGFGGQQQIITQDANDSIVGVVRPAGSIRLAGTHDAHGGDGASGGAGGPLLYFIATNQPKGQSFEVFGLASVDTHGGNGVTGGGNAGALSVLNPLTNNGVTGSAVVYPSINAKGGNAATSGGGGSGGAIAIRAGAYNQGVETKSQAVVVMGTLDASGGNGISAGGAGGLLDIQSRERVELHGAITAKGGSSSGNSAAAGASQPFTWRSGTAFDIGAALTLGGGNATGTTAPGGACGQLQILSGAIKASAAITCNGGAGTGAGGASGGITLNSSQTVTSYTTLTAGGGNGSPQGVSGAVVVDGNTL